MDPLRPEYVFGSFRLDPASRLLLRQGLPVTLTPKVFDLLVLLVRRSGLEGGRVMEKDELMKALWPESIVEESNLTQDIFWLRKALGQQRTGAQYIATVPGRGYAFVTAVTECAEPVLVLAPKSFWSAKLALALSGVALLVVVAGALVIASRSPARSEIFARRLIGGDELVSPGSASSDGRYLVYTARTPQAQLALVVRDVVSGRTRALKNHTPWTDAPKGCKLSSNSRYVACMLDPPNWDRTTYLQVIPADGSGEPRTVYRNQEWNILDSLTWSPDDAWIAGILHRPSELTSQIVLIAVKNGSTRTLKTLPGNAAGPFVTPRLCFSPDGRYLAYHYPPRSSTRLSDIYLLPTAGGEETAIIADPSHDEVLAWAADGRLVFTSTRTGTRDVWALPVVNGKPAGAPEMIRKDIGSGLPMGLARNGSFFYHVDTSSRDIYLAELDAAANKVLAGPIPVDQRYAGYKRAPDWSPDGRSLAYVSRGQIIVRRMDTGEERRIAAKLPRYIGMLRWSPDGRSLLLAQATENMKEYYLWRADFSTGVTKRVLNRDVGGDMAMNPTWSPDGALLFYKADNILPASAMPRKIFQWDPLTGEEKIFFGQSEFGTWALSPGGRQLAFATRDEQLDIDIVTVRPANGGPVREIFRTTTKTSVPKSSALAWTRDEQALLVPISKRADRMGEVWRVPVNGDPPHALFSTGNISELRLSPDGRTVVVASARFGQEVWMMQNFLPVIQRQ